jgi:hypothetical protein
VSCKTAQRHFRGPGLQGFPSLLLGPAEMEPDTGQARDSGGHHGDLRSRAEGGPLSTG